MRATGLLLVVVALAGCMGPGFMAAAAVDVSLDVVSAERRSEDCAGLARDGFECHVFEVRITNHGEEELTFLKSPFNWDVATDEGALYQADRVRGPDKLAPGGTGEVTVRVETDDAGLVFAEIRFKAVPWSDEAAVDRIGGY